MRIPTDRTPRTPAELRKLAGERKRYTEWLETLRADADAGDKSAINRLKRHEKELEMQRQLGGRVMLR